MTPTLALLAERARRPVWQRRPCRWRSWPRLALRVDLGDLGALWVPLPRVDGEVPFAALAGLDPRQQQED